MGTRTPPPERVQTPPTPLYGPVYASPRRSSRIHHKTTTSDDHGIETTKADTSRRRLHFQQPSQALSPPSSPLSPGKRASLAPIRSAKSRSYPEKVATMSTKSVQQSDARNVAMAYPTPAKTPRKRTQNTDFGSAARVLYHDLERDPDQIMPTPSKSRTRRKNAALSLEGLHDEHTPRSNKALHIYTDSKERMPEADNDDDNPFVVKKANKNAKQKAPPEGAISNNRKTRNGMSKAVDEAVDKDEGMVYTFRGKKIYRKFEDEHANVEDEPLTSSRTQRMLFHQAGPAASKRITRSSIKPRLLFPPKPEEVLPDPETDPEEAPTDIEDPDVADTHGVEDKDAIQSSDPLLEEPLTAESSFRSTDRPKRSPFDSWPRTKPGRASIAKRHGEPMEKPGQMKGRRN